LSGSIADTMPLYHRSGRDQLGACFRSVRTDVDRSSGPMQSRRTGLVYQHPLACFLVLTYSAAWFL
jgi:hypothetical protein